MSDNSVQHISGIGQIAVTVSELLRRVDLGIAPNFAFLRLGDGHAAELREHDRMIAA